MKAKNLELKEIKNVLKKNMPILEEKYKVRDIGIFGSYIRGKQKKKSDLDILVEFEETIDLFSFVELENFLSELLEIKVDLVMKNALKPSIRNYIMKEVIYL
jgi:hypothetical protein